MLNCTDTWQKDASRKNETKLLEQYNNLFTTPGLEKKDAFLSDVVMLVDKWPDIQTWFCYKVPDRS